MNPNWVQERLACSALGLSAQLRSEAETRIEHFNANRGARMPVSMEARGGNLGERLAIKIGPTEVGYFSYPNAPQSGRDFIGAGRALPPPTPSRRSLGWLHYWAEPHWDRKRDECVLKVTPDDNDSSFLMSIEEFVRLILEPVFFD